MKLCYDKRLADPTYYTQQGIHWEENQILLHESSRDASHIEEGRVFLSFPSSFLLEVQVLLPLPHIKCAGPSLPFHIVP